MPYSQLPHFLRLFELKGESPGAIETNVFFIKAMWNQFRNRFRQNRANFFRSESQGTAKLLRQPRSYPHDFQTSPIYSRRSSAKNLGNFQEPIRKTSIPEEEEKSFSLRPKLKESLSSEVLNRKNSRLKKNNSVLKTLQRSTTSRAFVNRSQSREIVDSMLGMMKPHRARTEKEKILSRIDQRLFPALEEIRSPKNVRRSAIINLEEMNPIEELQRQKFKEKEKFNLQLKEEEKKINRLIEYSKQVGQKEAFDLRFSTQKIHDNSLFQSEWMSRSYDAAVKLTEPVIKINKENSILGVKSDALLCCSQSEYSAIKTESFESEDDIVNINKAFDPPPQTLTLPKLKEGSLFNQRRSTEQLSFLEKVSSRAQEEKKTPKIAKNSSNQVQFKSSSTKLPSFVQAQNIKHYQKTANLQKKWKTRIEQKSSSHLKEQTQSQSSLKLQLTEPKKSNKKIDQQLLRTTLVNKIRSELDQLEQLRVSRNSYNKGASRNLQLPQISLGRRTVSPHLGITTVDPTFIRRHASIKLTPLSRFAVNSSKFQQSREDLFKN